MMNQFEVFKANGGQRWLTLVNVERYDFYIGFRSLVKVLP